MTAIVGVLNSQGVAIAADSALTVSGGKVKKVYNKSNKIFNLSKFQPVGIAIYNNSNFMGAPLETLIKMYRAKLDKRKFGKLTEYRDHFLKYLVESLQYVSTEYRSMSFYSFASEAYTNITKKIIDGLNTSHDDIQKLNQDDEISRLINSIAKTQIDEYSNFVNSFAKTQSLTISAAEFEKSYQSELTGIIEYINAEVKKNQALFDLNIENASLVKQVLYDFCYVDPIFEKNSGIVFIGFGDNEIYPSSLLTTLGTAIGNEIRYKNANDLAISPGILDSNIIPYAQPDVTYSVLTGIDPSYSTEINKSIESAFETIANEVKAKINVKDEADKIGLLITNSAKELIQKLDDYKKETITKPLLDTLIYMGKEDMAELAESLVNITSLKRKFGTSDASDESVGGPVDVAIITKGDGFIWMKRKHYFDIEINKGFLNRYYEHNE